MVLSRQAEQAIDALFPPTDAGTGPHGTHPLHPLHPPAAHPEQLLHATATGHRCYLTLQSLARDAAPIVRFELSRMSALLRQKVLFWDESEHMSGGAGGRAGAAGAAASSLFAWSSGDKYIAARRLQIQGRQGRQGRGTAAAEPLEPQPEQSRKDAHDGHQQVSAGEPSRVASALVAGRRPNLGRRLAELVQRESSRFIQARIDVIKAHHSERATRKLDERRRLEHERQLRRVQLKEEQYAGVLRAAIAAQDEKRHAGFFGALFGARPVSTSFTLPVPVSEMRPAATSNGIRGRPRVLELEREAPNLPARPLRGGAVEAPGSIGADPQGLPCRSPLVSARSSLEFEDYQSSSANTAPSHWEDVLSAGAGLGPGNTDPGCVSKHG